MLCMPQRQTALLTIHIGIACTFKAESCLCSMQHPEITIAVAAPCQTILGVVGCRPFGTLSPPIIVCPVSLQLNRTGRA